MPIDFLIQIRRLFTARVCNYGVEEVLGLEEWKKLLLDHIKDGITAEQEQILLELGVKKEEIENARKN